MSTTYTNDKAYANAYIVYINGLQVPVASVSVAYGVWQVPQAQITLVPDPVLHRLGAEDRVAVQVFYCDQWYRAPRPEFCLMFDGEITGWGTVSTTGGRALSFTCVDYIAILQQLFFFFMSSFDDMAVGASGASLGVTGSTVTLAGYGALYPYSLFSQGLADVGEGGGDSPTISRPIDFAYNIVRSLIKAQSPNRTVPASNFFAPWTKRTNFHKRWVALPFFDVDPGGLSNAGVFPILRAAQTEQALGAVARQASTVGSGGSMMAMLEEVLKNLMMEVTMIPTPAAVRSDFATLLPKGHPTQSTTGQVFLTNYFVKPQMFFGLPPMCNVFFPSLIGAYSYNENYATQPTRMYFSEEVLLSYMNPQGSNTSPGLGQMMQDALCTGFPEEVDIAARDATENRGQNGKNLLVYPEEFFKGPVIDRRPLPRWFVFLLQATQQGATPPGTVPEEQDSPDGDTVNIADPGAATDIRPIESTDELFGATDAVFNYRGARFQELERNLGFTAQFGSVAQGAVRDTLRARTSQALGSIETPSAFPVLEKSSATIAGDGGKGSFFAFRNGSRLHAGIDIGGPVGLTIVSATGGTVLRVANNTDDRGYCVEIKDTRGGVWRYIHLQEPALVVRRQAVQPGMPIGKLGTTFGPGKTVSPHLHLDATSSGGYRMNFTQALRQLKAGRSATTPTSTLRPAAGAQGVLASVPSPEPRTAPLPSALSPTESTRGIYRMYAAYEYYKERYARREGALSSAPFNPYPVPGFPCAVFDRRSTACDVVGYVMSVRHNLSPGGCSTDIAFSYGRTFSEMFALIQRNAALSAARNALNQASVVGEVLSRTAQSQGGARLSGDPDATAEDAAAQTALLNNVTLPQGSVAMAPVEPIPEISAVTQNFDTANEFYKGLFFHGAFSGAERLAAEDAARARGDTADLFLTEADAREVEQARTRGASEEELTQLVRNFVGTNQTLRTINQAQARTAGEDATLARRAGAPAVFEYPNYVEMLTTEGERVPITFDGVTSDTRTRMLGVINAIRSRSESAEDLRFLRSAAGDSPIFQRIADETLLRGASAQTGAAPLPEDISQFLAGLEIELRTTSATTNVRGDMTLVPTPSAEGMFASYTAAMEAVGRPICTLDEYIDFLGADGLREGTVHPNVASITREQQLYPAHFYTRIRRYKAGPPDLRPQAGTNAVVSSDAAAGPLAALDNATGAPAVDNSGLTRGSVQDQVTRAITTATVNAVISQALGEITAGADVAEAVANGNVYYVDPVPQNFPDNRGAWDVVLEIYRDNVYSRLPPRS